MLFRYAGQQGGNQKMNDHSMDEKTSILIELGLSQNEAKVYNALVQMGASTATKISEKSRIHRTNVYEAVERLKKKSLVASVTKDKTTLFEATDPETLSIILKEKEAKLNSIMPQFKLAQELCKKNDSVQMGEGLIAVKNAYFSTLEKKQAIYTMGSPKAASDVAKHFLNKFHKERIAKKIPMYHIYNADAKERINVIKKWPYTYVRILPAKFNSPVSTGICGDEVTLKFWDKKDGMAITIRSDKVAKSYKNYFDLLWEMAKPA